VSSRIPNILMTCVERSTRHSIDYRLR